MMTIKEFASLCGCTTQTLRYYDKIDLLKPVKADPWSGYRYYAKAQAVDFVKIKNFQAADFTINEIKALLTMSDRQVYEAFERKISHQSQKLERIREIQRSYLSEVNSMKKLVNSFCDYLRERVDDPELLLEFGMTSEDAAKMVDAVRSVMMSRTVESDEESRTVNLVINDELFEGDQAVEELTFLLREEELHDTIYLHADHILREEPQPAEDGDALWEAHGWTRVCEFLDQIPHLEDGKTYTLLFRLHNKPCSKNLSFPLFMVGSLLLRYGPEVKVECYAEPSTDGENHVTLLQKK